MVKLVWWSFASFYVGGFSPLVTIVEKKLAGVIWFGLRFHGLRILAVVACLGASTRSALLSILFFVFTSLRSSIKISSLISSSYNKLRGRESVSTFFFFFFGFHFVPKWGRNILICEACQWAAVYTFEIFSISWGVEICYGSYLDKVL